MERTKTEIQKEIQGLLSDAGFSTDFESQSFSELEEEIQSEISEEEIIYYSRAIAYLSENDASLTISLELAADMGYYAADLNSEILATLLLQQKKHESWSDIYSEISDLINEYEEAEEE